MRSRHPAATLELLAVAGMIALAACTEPPGVPVEISLAGLGAGAIDGVPGPLPVTQLGTTQALLHTQASTIDVWVRVPANAMLTFRTEPAVSSSDAFRILATIAGTQRELVITRGEGDAWQARIDGAEGALARIRLERRQPTFAAWREPRIVGTAHPSPPVLDTSVRPRGRVRPNVILYLVDALRADHLSVYGYPRDTTPNLARLVQHGVVFTNAYAAGPNTLISTPSLLASRHPSGLGANFEKSKVARETIAEAFRGAGYRTAAFVANTAVIGRLGFGRGFDEYVLNPPMPDAEPGLRATTDTLQRAALAWIRRDLERPFFVYIHTIDVHDRYVPAAFRGRFEGDGKHPAPAEPPRPRDRIALADFGAAVREAQGVNIPDEYDETIAWTDDQIGGLVHGLDALGVGSRTAIVVLADHGEALGAEDDGNHGHSHALYEELAHIPLVLVLPWMRGRHDAQEVVSHVDVAPTLAALAGIAGSTSWVGQNLFEPEQAIWPPTALMERLEAPWGPKAVVRPGLYGVAEWGVRAGPWKLLVDGERTRLFHLPSDPKETKDVSAAHPDEVGELLGEAWRRSPALAEGRAQPGGSPLDLDPERRQQLLDALRGLGYIE